MSTTDFDVIVIGGGAAGVCCAGELALQGARPLLVCETQEVGHLYRSTFLGSNRGVLQYPTRQAAWGGGWWFGLARDLNIPVRMLPAHSGYRTTMKGSGVHNEIPFCVSAAALVEVIAELSPIPMDQSRANLENVLTAALAIPYETLLTMGGIRFADWLRDQEADPLVTMMLLILSVNFLGVTITEATEHISVLGSLGVLRSYLCCEAELWSIFPDVREGLLMPIASEVERRGGAVAKGQRISRVSTAGGTASVVLADGSEFRAPDVAFACGNLRIAALLDPVPPEVEECIAYESNFAGLQEFAMFSLLDQPVDQEPRKPLLMLDTDGSFYQACWSIQANAPWAAEEGKYLLVSEVLRTEKQVAEMGGPEAVIEQMKIDTEVMFPGYAAALVDSSWAGHPNWNTAYMVGPKLQRRSVSDPSIWFVGEGSEPIGGIFVETAASAGILGARSLLAKDEDAE